MPEVGNLGQPPTRRPLDVADGWREWHQCNCLAQATERPTEKAWPINRPIP
jgi:hypothetical protein